MKLYNNGSLFTVSFNEDDTREFSYSWPCSTVRGKGSFQFEKRNGDLVDASGSALKGDGPDWLAFSHDCQEWGNRELKLQEVKREMRGLKAEMKAKGIRRVSCFNGGLTPDEQRCNQAVFQLKTVIARLTSEPVFPNRPN